MSETLECEICAEMSNDVTTNKCGHSFCEECTSRWSKNTDMCPLCKQRLKIHKDELSHTIIHASGIIRCLIQSSREIKLASCCSVAIVNSNDFSVVYVSTGLTNHIYCCHNTVKCFESLIKKEDICDHLYQVHIYEDDAIRCISMNTQNKEAAIKSYDRVLKDLKGKTSFLLY